MAQFQNSVQVLCVVSMLTLSLIRNRLLTGIKSLLKSRERVSLTWAVLGTGLNVLFWTPSSHLEKWLIILSLLAESSSSIQVQARAWALSCSQVRPLFEVLEQVGAWNCVLRQSTSRMSASFTIGRDICLLPRSVLFSVVLAIMYPLLKKNKKQKNWVKRTDHVLYQFH